MIWKALQLRPTFDVPLRVSRRDAMRRLQQAADGDAAGQAITFVMKGEYGELHLPAEQTRLWSPHLSISINESETSSHAKLHGRFAPRFHIWSAVWAIYLMMASVAFFALIAAGSQAMMGWSMSGLYVAAFALVLILAVNLAARIGQFWSADQMDLLRTRLDELLRANELIEDSVA